MSGNHLKKEIQAIPTNTPGNGSHPRLLSPDTDQGHMALAIVEKTNRALSTSKATGPRTESGKKRSSHNSTKIGIFSKATLLEGESRTDYERLSNGIRESLAPVGALEELLVEKLVAIMWRYQRMLRAEGAEIQKNSKFLQVDRQLAHEDEAEETSRRMVPSSGLWYDLFDKPVGLIWNNQNPEVIERCIELLIELRQDIKADGFVKERDLELLSKIYGDSRTPHLRQTLHENYLMWLDTANGTEEERASEGYATPAQCKQNVLREIDQEIKRLEECRRELQSTETDRMNLEILRQSVPDSPGLDRLLKYSSSLERDFDRTLGQLDRIQRVRRGQSVPPRVDININP